MLLSPADVGACRRYTYPQDCIEFSRIVYGQKESGEVYAYALEFENTKEPRAVPPKSRGDH